jgi:DNA recombination protein RmuC
MTLLAVVLAAIAAIVALVAVLRRPPANTEELAAVRNDLNLLRETTQQSLQTITNVFSQQLQATAQNVQTGLASVNTDVQNRLDSMNQHIAQRLNENAVAMTASVKSVTDSMTTVQTTFAGLQKQVGQMGEQARQLAEISRSLGDLQNILTAPKLRGGFGEFQLEALLQQVFSREQFAIQYKFPSGEIADAVLLFPQGMVAIDSKFSLENFRRIAQAQAETEKKNARRDFLKDVRKRIDEIAQKYIRPADGTLPFALMYVPAENVYYEAIIRDEDGNDLYSYCVQQHVMPVSPNSLYAYLQTILVGLKGLQVSKRAESILRDVASIELELKKFADDYVTVGRHLKNAAGKYDEGTRTLAAVQSRVQGLAGQSAEPVTLSDEAAKVLGSGV